MVLKMEPKLSEIYNNLCDLEKSGLNQGMVVKILNTLVSQSPTDEDKVIIIVYHFGLSIGIEKTIDLMKKHLEPCLN